MEYSDFPMPKSDPDYPHHAQIARYFDAYVDHFGFRDGIRFQTLVRRARRLGDGAWELTLDDGSAERFDALLVANGHHWDPRWPEPAFPGQESFAGTQIHAHSYRDSDLFAGKRVLIVGMGNSAMDIAVESSYVAEHTFLAARRGAWILPKYVFGRPVDQLPNDPRMPWAVRRRVFETLIRLSVGPPERFGLPKPDHRFGEAHPTVSGRILDRIQHGTVTPKPNIRRLDGDVVEFDDGTREPIDVVVYCTGYKISFPFFDADLIAAPDNHIELFRRVFHPEIDNVFFVALVQPLGATMPVAEVQGQWIADYLKGEYALPSRRAMLRDIEADFAAMRRRYVASKRHTIQVDFDDYLRDVERERRAGSERARRQGFRLPVAPRTAPVAVG
jgi:dimethylaniline monooxygenase (N-oxide forming)